MRRDNPQTWQVVQANLQGIRILMHLRNLTLAQGEPKSLHWLAGLLVLECAQS
jgi:hypothetical protein